jgi:hypothetical protein
MSRMNKAYPVAPGTGVQLNVGVNVVRAGPGDLLLPGELIAGGPAVSAVAAPTPREMQQNTATLLHSLTPNLLEIRT